MKSFNLILWFGFSCMIHAQSNSIWMQQDGLGEFNSSGNAVEIILANQDSIRGLQFNLSYDHAIIQFEDAVVSANIDHMNLYVSEIEPGTLTIVIIGMNGGLIYPSVNTALKFNFHVQDSTEYDPIPLSFSNVIFTNAYGNSVLGEAIDGYFFFEGTNFLHVESNFNDDVYINISNDFSLAGVQFTLSYNSDILNLNQVYRTVRSQGMDLDFHGNPGTITIILYSFSQQQILPGSGPVLNLFFESLSEENSSAILEISNVTISNTEGITVEMNHFNGTYFPYSYSSPSLIINEIMNNPSVVADSDGEWFEIVNNGGRSFDLNGWTIKDNVNDSHVISSSVVINPGEYIVFAKNANQNSNGGVAVDYQYDGMTLSNGDDAIILIDPNGTVFDSVAYDGGPEFPDLSGASMVAINLETDNNVGSNWQASTTTYGDGDLGTPGLPSFISDIDVELITIDFDTVLVGESLEKVLSISNTGNTPLVIDSIYTSSGLFTLPFTETSVETSLELTITFTPSAYDIVEDTLVIKTNDHDESHVEIPLTGFGYIPSPNIILESTSIDFGNVMDGLLETENFLIYNTGDMILEIDTMYISGASSFSLFEYDNVISAGDSSIVPVAFLPDDEAQFEGTLTIIVSNDPDVDTLEVILLGIGGEQTPLLTLSSDIIYFGEEIAFQDTMMEQITISNQGMLDLEIEEIQFDTNLVWTDFSDISLQPQDSTIIDIYFYTSDSLNLLNATMIISSNDYIASVQVCAGNFVKIQDKVIRIGNPGEFNVYMNNTELIGAVIFELNISNSDLILENGWEITPTQRTAQWVWQLNDPGDEIDRLSIVGFGPLEGADPMQPGDGSIATIKFENNIQEDRKIDFSFHLDQSAVQDVGNPPNDIIYNSLLYQGGSVTFYAPPTTPEGLELTFDNGIRINWNENTDNDFSHFILDKSFDGQFEIGDYSSIMIYEHSYLDTSYQDGQMIYYRLSSIDILGYSSDFSEIVSLEVLNVNDAPVLVTGIADITVAEDSEMQSFSLISNGDSLYFDDADIISGDLLSYVVSEAIGGLLMVESTEDSVQVSFMSDSSGVDTLFVTATDLSGLSAVDTIVVTVTPVNDIPQSFSLLTPGNSSSIIIQMSDLISQSAVEMSWQQSLDSDNDAIIYGLKIEAGDWSSVAISGLTDTTYSLPYAVIAAILDTLNASDLSIDWTIFSTDSVDTVFADEVFSFYVDAYGVLSTVAEIIPDVYALHQNYPNPFNPVTNLIYELPKESMVNITIHDMMGRVVKTLVNSSQTAGYKSILWNATNNRNEPISVGLYLYTIQAGEFRQTKKMVMIK